MKTGQFVALASRCIQYITWCKFTCPKSYKQSMLYKSNTHTLNIIFSVWRSDLNTLCMEEKVFNSLLKIFYISLLIRRMFHAQHNSQSQIKTKVYHNNIPLNRNRFCGLQSQLKLKTHAHRLPTGYNYDKCLIMIFSLFRSSTVIIYTWNYAL